METSAVAGDQDQQWLLNCLSATLDPNQEVRSFAEVSLNQASLQPGFGAALSKEGEESFELPAVSSEEKEVIRKLLLSSLDDTHRKICTAISMAVASIAAYDWPEDWPDLLPFLLKLITDQSNMNGVHGGLRCLALLSADLDDATVPKLVPVLFPVLHTIVSFPESYDRYVRTKALSIVYSCTAMLGVMSGVCKTEMFALMMPMLKPWMNHFSIILEHPVQPEDPDDWGIKMEVLKCLNQFIQNFPSLAEIVVRSLWQTFVSSLRVYTRSSIEGTEDPYAGRYDSDGAEKSLDSFVVQLFEFLLTIVGSAKLVKVIASNVRELVYHTIAFLQMTEQQIHIWSIDANQFLADEDESTYSCRVSGALLLEEVVSYCGREGIDAIIDAASKRFNESQQEKAAGSTVWWRMREATLFALAFLSEQLLEAEVSGLTSVRLGELLEQMITEDIGTGVHQYPFLYARIFASVARFSSAISDGVLEHFLSAAITTIAMDVPPPVKVGACRALSELLPKANKGNFQPQMMGLFSSLADLLHQARDETLHLVLETLQAAIKAGFLTASMEPMISPLILNIWALHVSDPFISIDAIEVLEVIKCSPGCIHQLASRILPYVGPILNNSASTDVVKAAYDVCFDAVIQIILQSEDHSEMQVHMSAPNVEWFINMLMTIPSEGYGEIQGAYPIKVTTTALALLLSTRHPELAKINVQGHLIKSDAGITTRAKAKLAPDQWTVLPLPAKILTLLTDALIEIQEQVLGDDDEEDSDWEEVQEGDVESDKDLIYSTGAASLGRPTYEHLEAMAKNQGDDYEDDILCVSDPLNEVIFNKDARMEK
ncbi:hypothetical protein CUMW_266420 [Citrus unshiu]|uniref:Importin-9 central HEAT repeats domain-containing protein n=1 Tax=Citrus unshiu TaxID=55188 RepID=A0A2H5QVR5_CITUN|nr:hypothetical protein CUMW_266420 [Citrus unshiu]